MNANRGRRIIIKKEIDERELRKQKSNTQKKIS